MLLTGLTGPEEVEDRAEEGRMAPFEWLQGRMHNGRKAVVDIGKLVYFDRRDFDEGEQRLLDMYGVKAYTTSDIER